MTDRHSAFFRFYEELNDFLPKDRRKQTLLYQFRGRPAIKDPIEALGVPHTEVDLITVNGVSVGFDYRLRSGDRVAVYPTFESFDITPLVKLRDRPLRRTAFVADVNLGKLARRLRMLGFDVLYDHRYQDGEIVAIAAAERRIVLTRDRRLLFHRRLSHGLWIRATEPEQQVREVLDRCDLWRQIQALRRCLVCNGVLQPVPKAQVLDRLEPKTREYYQEFFRCPGCERIYWEGSHVADMRSRYLAPALAPGSGPESDRG
ncbi:Mut7-C RNAse domain-containing protein [Candidatus Methylocalor cossyra]|uniref:Twitching motility protein PilT n=1 Tax=Candidatus Methylocalor cossyra TaxID=3108543 RepID=A0ABM9NK83_9GAMM